MGEMTSLREQLSATAKEGRAKRDPAKQVVFDEASAKLKNSGLENHALKAGAIVPDFSLPDQNGKAVTLKDLLSRGPVVISFYRGGWCPYCNLELRALQSKLGDIKAAGASLVAISPQTPDDSLDTQQKNALAFDVLSDANNDLARKFGLVFELPDGLAQVYLGMGLDLAKKNGTTKWELPVPATYVIDQTGKIRHAFIDTDYTQRLEPLEIIAALKKL